MAAADECADGGARDDVRHDPCILQYAQHADMCPAACHACTKRNADLGSGPLILFGHRATQLTQDTVALNLLWRKGENMSVCWRDYLCLWSESFVASI